MDANVGRELTCSPLTTDRVIREVCREIRPTFITMVLDGIQATQYVGWPVRRLAGSSVGLA